MLGNGKPAGKRTDAFRARVERKITLLLLMPCVFFLLILFVIPVGYVLILSVTDPSFGISQYTRIFSTKLYLLVLYNTFYIAFLVTLICILLGYPLAYVIACRNDGWSSFFFFLVVLSFWTGFIVRSYSWMVILGQSGPAASLLKMVGFDPPPQMLFTSFSSLLGMTHIMLPYMVMALYSVMRKFEPNYMRAAESLGARPFTAFRTVFIPLSLPGVVNGSVLVFTICLGFYITPILLGGPRDIMLSQLINQQIIDLLNWGFAASLSVVLLVVTAVVLFIYNRLVGLDKLWG